MIVTGRDSGVTRVGLAGLARLESDPTSPGGPQMVGLLTSEEALKRLAEGSGLNGLPSALDVCLTSDR